MIPFMITIVLCILVFGTLYIVSVTRMNHAESGIREGASNLDSMIAERYHIIKRLLPILKEAGIDDNETLNQTVLIRIGMTVSEQKLAYTLMKNMEPVLSGLCAEQETLSQNSEFKGLVEDFINLEGQIMKVADDYNTAVEKYNGVIAQFPVNLIANFKKKYARSYFEV